MDLIHPQCLATKELLNYVQLSFSLCFLYERHISRFEELSKVFLPLVHCKYSCDQQLPAYTANSVGRVLPLPSEVPTGLPEFFRSLLHGVACVFFLQNCLDCSTPGLPQDSHKPTRLNRTQPLFLVSTIRFGGCRRDRDRRSYGRSSEWPH